ARARSHRGGRGRRRRRGSRDRSWRESTTVPRPRGRNFTTSSVQLSDLDELSTPDGGPTVGWRDLQRGPCHGTYRSNDSRGGPRHGRVRTLPVRQGDLRAVG